ncbi:membrane protein insertion efficiency factor YidD [Salininema proteolyticum]|uniref:Membrane protein insertion efficiency factor YidD n=1 Tax=Salininema proteolyticum TaxID=1607685 RepID=A0ABV8TXN1_9ACTN
MSDPSLYQEACSQGCSDPASSACNPDGPCRSCGAACGGARDAGPFSMSVALFVWARLDGDRLARAEAAHRPWARDLGLRAIAFYRRRVSRRLNVTCRYVPSCSGYGYRAVRRYGLWTGSRLALLRIWHCRPGVRHGTRDPVPAPGADR